MGTPLVVPSPTPMMPMSGERSSLTCMCGRRCFKVIAARKPALPPPSTSTLFTMSSFISLPGSSIYPHLTLVHRRGPGPVGGPDHLEGFGHGEGADRLVADCLLNRVPVGEVALIRRV